MAQPNDGASRTRTGDLLGAIQALSQLSYSPAAPRVAGISVSQSLPDDCVTPQWVSTAPTDSLRYSRNVEAATRLDDVQLVQSLRDGDEATFALLTREYHHSLLRVARIYVSSRAVAEEVVQETWLGVLQGLDRGLGHGVRPRERREGQGATLALGSGLRDVRQDPEDPGAD